MDDTRARAAAVLAEIYKIPVEKISEAYDGKEITLIADAVAQAVKETKIDAIALCAAEFERGLLSGRAEQAEEIARLRAALEEILRVSIVYEPADRRVENMRRTAKAALAPAPPGISVGG